MGNQGGRVRTAHLTGSSVAWALLRKFPATQCLPTLVTCEAGNEISMSNNVQEAMQGRESTVGTQRFPLGE